MVEERVEEALELLDTVRELDEGFYASVAAECGGEVARALLRASAEVASLLERFAEAVSGERVRILVSPRGLFHELMAPGAKAPTAVAGREVILVDPSGGVETVLHELCHHIVATRCFGGDYGRYLRAFRESLEAVVNTWDAPEEALCIGFARFFEDEVVERAPRLYTAVSEAMRLLAEAADAASCSDTESLAREAAERAREAARMLSALPQLVTDREVGLICAEVRMGYRRLGIQI